VGIAAGRGPVVINDIVYSEFSAGFITIEEIDMIITEFSISHIQIPLPALFMAAKAHQRYRAAGGTRTGTLPDFFVGAHAAVTGIPLLTRDTRRYKTYFPTLDLISPSLA
jgi:predicted nucleic acid-binding protein